MFLLLILFLMPLAANADACFGLENNECMNTPGCSPTNDGCEECPEGSYCPGANAPQKCSDWASNLGRCPCPAPVTESDGGVDAVDISACYATVTCGNTSYRVQCEIDEQSGECATSVNNATQQWTYSEYNNFSVTKLMNIYIGDNNNSTGYSLYSQDGDGIPNNYHIESQPVYSNVITQVSSQYRWEPVSYTIACVPNTMPCSKFGSESCTQTDVSVCTTKRFCTLDENNRCISKKSVCERYSTNTDCPQAPDSFCTWTTHINGGKCVYRNDVSISENITADHTVSITYNFSNITGRLCHNGTGGNAVWNSEQLRWDVSGCKCPSLEEAQIDTTAKCYATGAIYKPLQTPSVDSLTKLYSIEENIIFQPSPTYDHYQCSRCISDNSAQSHYYIACDSRFSTNCTPADANHNNKCTTDISGGIVCSCIPLTTGYTRTGTCNSNTDWDTNHPICTAEQCGIGQTTTIGNTEPMCHFSNSTKICDVGGCKYLGSSTHDEYVSGTLEANQWQSMLP
ncbi:MAG: hypothetical protein J6T57_01960 [Alphaproteobacteria bacterium]|nr:hypothetical protein [Alphaproteobacteria bacterium]